jgi:hypothetical protein
VSKPSFPPHWTTVHTLSRRLEHVMTCAAAHPHNQPLKNLVRELSEELDRLLDDQEIGDIPQIEDKRITP